MRSCLSHGHGKQANHQLTVSLYFQCIVELAQETQLMDQIHRIPLVAIVTGETGSGFLFHAVRWRERNHDAKRCVGEITGGAFVVEFDALLRRPFG